MIKMFRNSPKIMKTVELKKISTPQEDQLKSFCKISSQNWKLISPINSSIQRIIGLIAGKFRFRHTEKCIPENSTVIITGCK